MNSNIIVADVQGFKNTKNEFIIKEFAYCTFNYTQVFLIKPPYMFSKLNNEEKKLVKWVEYNQGFYWNQGHIDYREFKRVIKPILSHKLVIVKGLEKTIWVKDLCHECNVVNVEIQGCPNLYMLKTKYAVNSHTYNCFVHKKQCALSNALCVKKWCIDNSVFLNISI